MKFKIDGVELVAAENIRIGEMCEAEKQLGIAADETGMAGRLALSLYVTMRRAEPEKPMHITASEVMDADMTSIEEVADESPPAEGVNGAAPEPPLISGLPDLVKSA